MLGGCAYGADPGLPQDALQRQRDPDQPDARLCRRSCSSTGWCAVRGATRRASISRRRSPFDASADAAEILATAACHLGVVFALIAVARRRGSCSARTLKGFEIKVLGQSAARRALRRLLARAHGVLRLPGLGRRLPGSPASARSPARSASCSRDLARLRLHRDHRRLPRPAQSARHPRRRAGPGARPISAARRRRSTLGVSDKVGAGLPGHAAVLRARLRHADPLPHPLRRPRSAKAHGAVAWSMLEAILLTIITASTPLLLAALGELVVERSGVLNLGVEGMMVDRAPSPASPSRFVDRLALARRARRDPRRHGAASLLFGFLTLDARRQPGGDRPGADTARARLVRADRRELRRPAGRRHRQAVYPWPVATCRSSARSVFGQDPIVYLSLAARRGVAWFLFRTRAGLILRAVGDNHGSAHALGYPVIAHPLSLRPVRRRLRRAWRAAICRWSTRRNGWRT